MIDSIPICQWHFNKGRSRSEVHVLIEFVNIYLLDFWEVFNIVAKAVNNLNVSYTITIFEVHSSYAG